MTLQTIIGLAAIILLPLIPAMLIYWTLPSRTSVGGPFKGLQINLTGAFAGYFLLVLAAFGVVETIRPDETKFPRYEEYTILGSIDLEGPELNNLDARLVQLYMYPRIEDVDQVGSNHFEWVGKLPMRRDFENNLSFPYEKIVIEYPGFMTQQIDFRSGTVQESAGKITFKPVLMKARPPKSELPTVELKDAPP